MAEPTTAVETVQSASDDFIGGMAESIFPSEQAKAAPTPIKEAEAVKPKPEAKATPAPAPTPVKSDKADPSARAGQAEALPDPTKPAVVADDDDAPKDLSEKGKADWKSLKQKIKEYEQKEKSRQSELERIQKTSPKPEEYEGLKKTLEDYQNRLRVVDVEKDPKFQQYFEGRQKQLMETAKSIGGENAERLTMLLALPDSKFRNEQLDAIASEMGPTQAARLGSVINDLERLQSEKKSELENASQRFELMRQQREAQMKEQSARMNKLLDDTLNAWSDPQKGMPAFQKREGDDEWNSKVDRGLTLAREIFNGQLDPAGMARAAAWSAAAPQLLSDIQQKNAKIAELMEEVEALRGSQPDLKTGGSKVEAGSPDAIRDGESVPEFLERTAKSQGWFSK